MNFTKTGEYTGISKKLNNGDFNYYLSYEIINMVDCVEEPTNKYIITLSAVSPSQAGKEHLKSALNEEDNINNLSEEQKAILLSEYGTQAILFDNTGNNLKVLLKEVKEQAKLINLMFGFYMDKHLNRIGSTGWDFIKGEF